VNPRKFFSSASGKADPRRKMGCRLGKFFLLF
jgi:hypothetical protein